MNITRGILHIALCTSTKRMANGDTFLASVEPERAPASPPLSLSQQGNLEKRTVLGATVWRFVPTHHIEGLEILYAPGGAYVFPTLATHWKIVTHIAKQTGAAITLANYPLAPEHDAADTMSVLDAVWEDIALRTTTKWKLVAGDSAGGHAAITLAIRHQSNPDKAASGVVGISPWIDLTLTNPDAKNTEPVDPMLRVAGARAAGKAWASPLEPDDVSLQPLKSDLKSPVLLLQGQKDILYSDTILFKKHLAAQGTHVTLIEEPDAFHVYPGATWTPEAKRAFAAIATFVRDIRGS